MGSIRVRKSGTDSVGKAPAGSSWLKRWGRLALLVILVAGAGLRGAYLLELRHDPFYRAPALDAQFHSYWARGLAGGDWIVPEGRNDPRIRETPYFRPPGYPYVLAAVYAVCGRNPMAPRVFQSILGLLTALLGYLLARRWFGTETGLLLAGFLACYWVFPYFEGQLLDPSLLTFLLLAGASLLSLVCGRHPLWAGAGAGVVLGAAALVRPNVLAMVPFVLAWAVWVLRRRGAGPGVAIKTCALILAGLAVTIAPATLRNRRVSGEWVLISSNAGINLLIGNHPGADGVTASIPGIEGLTGKTGWTCFDYPQVLEGLGKRLGHPVRYTEASRYWARRALRYVREDPVRFVRLTAKRLALFWGPAQPEDRDVSLTRRASPVLRHLPGNFPLVLSLALVGAVLAFRDTRANETPSGGCAASPAAVLRERTVLVVLLVASYSASFLPFFFNTRYRVPLLPFLMLFAAHGVCRWGEMARARRWRAAAVWGGAWMLCLAAASVNIAGYRPPEAEWHYQRANAWRDAGDPERAVGEYRKALALQPGDARAANDLGMILLRQGKAGEAEGLFRRALAAKPDLADARFNLATLLARRGAFREAAAHYRAGLEVRPRDVRARVALGTVLFLLGDPAGARGQYEEALRIAPGFRPARDALARLSRN